MVCCTRLLKLILCLSVAVIDPANAQQAMPPSTVPLLHTRTRLLIVYVRINGNGPFKLILDTGSNISLLESSLFHELGLKEVARPSRKVIGWMTLGKLAVAQEISIEDGPSREDVSVLEVDGIKRPDIDPSVRGVLGENFLGSFDLLVDNRNRRITFDGANVLTASVSGERLPLATESKAGGIKVTNRPMVSATVNSFNPKRTLHLLLDTGIESVHLYLSQVTDSDHLRNVPNLERGDAFPSGSAGCAQRKERLMLGSTISKKVLVFPCDRQASDGRDGDGTLPTFIFDRVLISHSKKYVIFNPVDTRLKWSGAGTTDALSSPSPNQFPSGSLR